MFIQFCLDIIKILYKVPVYARCLFPHPLLSLALGTQELHIKGTVPSGSLVGGAFLAQAYKILDLSLHVPSSQSLKT